MGNGAVFDLMSNPSSPVVGTERLTWRAGVLSQDMAACDGRRGHPRRAYWCFVLGIGDPIDCGDTVVSSRVLGCYWVEERLEK